ncbi:MAG: RNA 2',3'-cyclic phosphodiesterase [Thermoleophilaceae bacterium]
MYQPENERRSQGSGGTERARLFVALDLPEPTRASIAAWRDRTIAGRDELRPVAAASLHVTLCFLGWRPESEAPAIAEAALGACAGLQAPLLRPRALAPVPPRRPRLFALDLDDAGGAAGAVQAAISDSLEAAGFYEPESRPFWPHLTVARVRRGARAAPLEAGPPPGEPFTAADLTLYRSTLRPRGALYEPLARLRLGAPAAHAKRSSPTS